MTLEARGDWEPAVGPSSRLILIAENSAFARNVLASALEHEGYQVARASDSTATQQTLQYESVDLVFCSLESLSWVRRISSSEQLPVIVLGNDASDGLQAFTSGANDYLPYDLNRCLTRIRMLLKARDPGPTASGRFKRLGRYQLDRVLGEGAMGTVYLAHDTQTSRKVALKVLHRDLKENALQRFMVEARAGARIRHPAIVSIHEVCMRPVPYLVMDYVEGCTLDIFLQRYGRNPAWVLPLIAQVAELLGVLHQAGIVHRDVKPTNLMVDEDGKVHLLDFGLAKFLGTGGGPTRPGQIVGTPAYLAPEQVDPSNYGTLDQQSDLYSLGVLLYESLVGRFPYRTYPLTTLFYDVLHTQPEIPPYFDPMLAHLCLRALAKRKEDRFVNARHMQAALLEGAQCGV